MPTVAPPALVNPIPLTLVGAGTAAPGGTGPDADAFAGMLAQLGGKDPAPTTGASGVAPLAAPVDAPLAAAPVPIATAQTIAAQAAASPPSSGVATADHPADVTSDGISAPPGVLSGPTLPSPTDEHLSFAAQGEAGPPSASKTTPAPGAYSKAQAKTGDLTAAKAPPILPRGGDAPDVADSDGDTAVDADSTNAPEATAERPATKTKWAAEADPTPPAAPQTAVVLPSPSPVSASEAGGGGISEGASAAGQTALATESVREGAPQPGLDAVPAEPTAASLPTAIDPASTGFALPEGATASVARADASTGDKAAPAPEPKTSKRAQAAPGAGAPASKTAVPPGGAADGSKTVAAASADDRAPSEPAGTHPQSSAAGNTSSTDASVQAPATLDATALAFAPVSQPLAATSVTATPEPAASAQTVANLSAQIVQRADQKTSRFDVQLTPDGLGRVDVAVEIDAKGKVTAALSFEKADSAALVKSDSASLQAALSAAGLSLADGDLKISHAADSASNAQASAASQPIIAPSNASSGANTSGGGSQNPPQPQHFATGGQSFSQDQQGQGQPDRPQTPTFGNARSFAAAAAAADVTDRQAAYRAGVNTRGLDIRI